MRERCCYPNLTLFVIHFSILLLISSAMPKLYFRHGAVSSAKTLNLLAVQHTYRIQGKNVILMKPALDTRFGADNVTSRAGLSQSADFLLKPDTNILKLPIPRGDTSIHCVLVDEVQFLNVTQIDQLRLITTLWNVPVICYGLRTDFRTHLFPGSRRLLELADTIEEVKTTCHFCNSKAILNLKHVNGVADTSGPAVQLGAEEKYFPTCYRCYRENVNEAGQSPVSDWRTTEKELDVTVSGLSIRDKKVPVHEEGADGVDSPSSTGAIPLDGTPEKKSSSP
mmetsp:Transcript_22953/g.38274  ORF Transcript_22953/g.38274 Transcript_22953/m.38274 type:complete len:281 (-) Transcript_22953:339-1181(-)